MQRKGLRTTEARRRASHKWEQENAEKITIKWKKGDFPSKDQIRHAAEQCGQSVNAWILDAIREKI